MSTYSGNPSLATAVKERVTSTFEQALALFRLGRIDEVVAGCSLILQMDPLFDPAKKLLEKARNPAAAIDVESLMPSTGAAQGDLQEAREALAARDFQRVVNITTEILTNDLMNDEARILGDEAREKMEAGPFIDQFARKCEQHLAASNIVAAQSDLEKMRSLDPTHPTVIRLTQTLAARGSAPGTPQTFSFEAPPSFVVDTPAPSTGRAPAPAADFGFTFEEDKVPAAPASGSSVGGPAAPAAAGSSGGSFSFDKPAAEGGAFSFDTPAAAGGFGGGTPQSGGFSFDAPGEKTPASGQFDFSAAAMEASPEDRQKIEQYLADGDSAFDSGDYQQAIDLWSRIFLIDVTNDLASERIESAKTKRSEIEQKTEPLLTAATQAYERKDYETARLKFNEVLRADPFNTNARDYLERLPASTIPRPGSAPPPVPGAKRDIFADDDSYDSSILPPEATPAVAKPAVEKQPSAKVRDKPAKGGLPLIPIAAALAVLVLAVGGWFAWSKFSKPAYDPSETQATFKQAGTLSKQGKLDEAISLLQEVKPEDPQHDKAVIMIADLQHRKSHGNELVEGKPAAVYFNDQLTAGRTAFEAHDYDGAKKSFEAAMRVKALPPDMKSLYETAAQQVSKLDGTKSLFRARQYQDALGNLEQLVQQDPQNQNIRRMIIDAHFNLGAMALQEERLDDATKQFDEVLKLVPTDELAKRSKELAARYNGQPKDLLFRIYVKYLPLRQVS
jgi:tetratricopeptide (TPR) repeat protein